MKRFSIHKNAGMTLIEIIVAVALLGMIVIGAYSLVDFGRVYMNKSQQEYQFQFSTRLALQNTSNIIRYSTAVFTIPQSSFGPDNLDAGWDYIGIQEAEISPGVMGNEIVKYTYDDATGTHIPTVLIAPQQDIVYKFVFTKVNPQDEDSLLQFTIRSYPAGGNVDEYGNPSAAVTITSEVEAQNSLQVIDLSSPPYDPAAAIAFRSQERLKSVVGHVAMVLDTSGSMSDNLNGGSSGQSRISILKDRAKTLINSFATEDNIDVKLVPFATSANKSMNYVFRNAKTSTASLIADINNLDADGGTNTGDGLRRAYWALKTHNGEVAAGVRASNYLIILVDGVTTFASAIDKDHNSSNAANVTYVTADGNVNEGYLDRTDPYNSHGQIVGNGSELDSKGTAYVNLIGRNYIRNFAKVYVIGFSAINSELNSVNDIATACGAASENVYTASSSTALSSVFDAVRQDIVNDLWFLQGPQL